MGDLERAAGLESKMNVTVLSVFQRAGAWRHWYEGVGEEQVPCLTAQPLIEAFRKLQGDENSAG